MFDDQKRTQPPLGRSSGERRLPTRAPFHLEATVRVLQRRPTNSIDQWEGRRYLRVFRIEDRFAITAVENRGTIDRPDVRYSMLGGSSAAGLQIESLLRRMLGLDVDPGPLQRLLEAEPALGSIAVALRGMRPPRFACLFETFLNVVPFQQVSLEAGLANVTRLAGRFGRRIDEAGRSFHTSPTARSIAEARLDDLKACGLSLRKADALRHVARAIEAGDLVEEHIARAPTGDALHMLRELPGVGPWSANLVLLRGFGRLDIFPPGDVGAARGLVSLLRRSDPAWLDDVIERFGDRRGYLYFCALGGALLAKGFIRPASPLSGARRHAYFSQRRNAGAGGPTSF
ncbi:AlkA N-terminal domain-containing protein [Methylocystis sp. IM3]|uniref:DNA-3-methyladenine glycosylase 2 n=1 Tax=unclassified Methylocystis TaxID=2625913 RepID=UPI0030FB6ADE